MDIELILSPTQEESGSPDIKISILEQIKSSDAFVGDVSFIDAKNFKSNGNVLYETGIADAFLGEERVILVCDENTVIEKIDFDVNHKRISKINTTKRKSQIKNWIKAALEESDKHRYIKTYATNQYEEDLLILINYFYRYINITKKKYKDDFLIPSIDSISKEIENSKFPVFFLNADFNDFIEHLEEKMLRLNQFSHKRIIWNIINIITKLKEYQKFCTQTRYSFINIIDEEKEQYNVYEARNFYLKSADDFSFDRKTILFLDNSEIINGENGYFVMDKNMFKKDDLNYKFEVLSMDSGIQRVIVGKSATISPKFIPIIAPLISNILLSIKEYLDYCNLNVSFESEIFLSIN